MVTARREKNGTTTWLLKCLISSIRSGSIIKLNIPPTIILSGDSHNDFLRTGEDGRLCVNTTQNGSLEHALSLIRQFNQGCLSCVVWYASNEREVLGLDFVFNLAASTCWRRQALAIQGYFSGPLHLETGSYCASEEGLFGSCGSIKYGAARVGLNLLTKALAKCVVDDNGRKLRLDSIQATYVIDGKGTLWFSHATDIQLRISEKVSTVLPAQELVESELRWVLRQAIKAGASIDELFGHFDPFDKGFVGSNGLKAGLSKFGIGVSNEVAGMLIQEFVGAPSFTVDHLAAFARLVVRSPIRRLNSCHEENSLVHGQFPLQRKPPVGVFKNKSIILHQGRRAEHEKKQPDIATRRSNDRNQAVVCSGGVVRADEENEPLGQLGPRSTSKYCSFRWDDLPHWARQASKSTLQELMGLYQRSLKKARANAARHSADLMNDLDSQNNPHRILQGDMPNQSSRSSSPRVRHRPASSGDAHSKSPAVSSEAFAKGDFKVHVGGGNVMTYRWVERAVAKPNHGGSVLEAMEALSTSQEAMGLQVAQHESFLLVVMPDLFMTLDSMERCLGGLLEHNPRGKLLLVGSLGLPGTQWSDQALLDAKTNAQGLSSLLWRLMERGELCVHPPMCVILLGLGSGANAVLNFAGSSLIDKKFAPLRDSTRFLALVNPFPALTQDTTVEIRQIKRHLQVLKKTLETGVHHEQLQSLLSTMFSTDHLRERGRAAVLQEFWQTRQKMELPEPGRPKSAPAKCKVNPHSVDARHTGGVKHGQKNGVLESMEGILHGTTLEALNGNVNTPVLLVTSTRDALDTSNTAKHCRAALEAEEVESLFRLVGFSKHRRIMVYPVEGGREILQEAPVRTLEILSTAIRAALVVGNSAGTAKHLDGQQSQDDAMDVTADHRTRGSPSSWLGKGCHLSECSQIQSFPRYPAEKENRKGKTEHPARTPELARNNPLPVKGKERRAPEFDARKERAAAKKARSERLKRQRELKRRKTAKQKEDESRGQQRECISMHQEDERSTDVDRYVRGLEIWAESVANAKERALELTSTRDASDQKLVDDQLARERARQHIQRSEMFQQRKLGLLEQHGVDDCGTQFPSGQHDEVELARETCLNLLDQLVSFRRQIVKMMQMELLRREQFDTFQSQYQKLEADLRASRMIRSTYARGGTVAGVLGEVSMQEWNDIGNSVDRKHALLGTYQSVLRERREVWDLTVSHVQKLKIAISAKESELRTTLHQIRLTMAALKQKAGRIRANNGTLAALRSEVESKTKAMNKRIALLNHEQSLLTLHKGDFFDSDIWQQGVTQRMSKRRFAQDLQTELANLRQEIKKNTQKTTLINETLASDALGGLDVEMALHKLAQIAHISQECFDRVNAQTVADELRVTLEAEQEIKSVDPSAAVTSLQNSVAETIRNKSSHQRSLEEKQWVALDILVNGDLYKAFSDIEREELQLNDEYKTELKAEDVERILGLPYEIQLALPHLKSPAEVNAHNLLATYTLEHGDAALARADEHSQDHLFVIPSAEFSTSKGYRILPGEGLETATAKNHEDRAYTSVNTSTKMDSSRHEESAGLEGRSSPKLLAQRSTATVPFDSNQVPILGAPSLPQDTTRLNIFESLSDIALKNSCENDGEMAIRIGEREVHRSASNFLGLQESRVHTFTVVNVAPIFTVDLKVAITFSGCIDSRGFNMGRISAVLRRKSVHGKGLESCTDRLVGYSPHALQKLNLGDKFYQTPGSIVILHCPSRVALPCGTYEVEVTALGPTAYEVVVVAGQCELCASVVAKRLEEARNLKEHLAELDCELDNTWEGVRLRERQYHVCNALVEEAHLECLRCQEAIDELCDSLGPRNVGIVVESLLEESSSKPLSAESEKQSTSSTSRSSSTRPSKSTTAPSLSASSSSNFSETEHADIRKKVAGIETEYMHFGRLFTTRCQEKASVKKALGELMKLRRYAKAEKVRLKEQLERMSAEIPIVVEILRGSSAAAEISRELDSDSGIGKGGRRSSARGDEGQRTIYIETPAGKTRQAFERGGWEALSLEEQRWVTLDQELCPEKYKWLQDLEEEARYAQERGKGEHVKLKKFVVDTYRFHRDEIMRILAAPTDDLTRTEIHARKLLHKFHDDPQLVGGDDPMACSETHSSSLAHRTRQKDKNHRTGTEKAWISLDKILNPQIWKRAKGDMPGTRNDERPSVVNDRDMLSDEQVWACPFSRDELLRIWTRSEDTSSMTEDEKQAFKLLTTYNGTFPGEPAGVSHGWKGVQMGKGSKGPDIDIDQRLRSLQRELDLVSHNRNPTIVSSILHAAPQRYPNSTLRLSLETEIDRLLREQVQQRERKNVYLVEDYSSSEDDEAHYNQCKKRETRMIRRLNRRANRGAMNIFDARKRMLLESKKTPLEKDNARRIANLGPGGCSACMSNPCKRIPVIDPEGTKSRLENIADELHFARTSTEDIIESSLPLSVQRNGVTSFRRTDFIERLTSEQKQLRYMLKLHYVDEELHEATGTSKQHVECVALHGYRTILWTKDARVALQREHSRLVARMVAVDIIDDILAWMLEGWHFGERQSPHMRTGVQMSRAIHAEEGDKPPVADERIFREQEEDRVASFTLPPGVEGSSWNKVSERVVKDGGFHDKEIGFMEKTMRFGLFCVAIMYFRAIWLVRRQERHASEFKSGWKIDTSVSVRARRKSISQITVSSAQAGYQRVKVRKEKEQAEVLADFVGFVAVEKRELDASRLIQRILRGHIGRKAAHRWREKRAEYNATNSLMVSAAVSVQRALRGSWGRCRAKTIRAGIARWLVHLIDDEAREFEADVLSTNMLEAVKRGIEELAVDNDSDEATQPQTS